MDIVEMRSKIKPILSAYGVKRAGLFGSAARGTTTDTSDIDIAVDITKDISLFDFVGLKQQLEAILGKPVDLVEYQAIKPTLKDSILRNHIPLYERG